ncbi:MAG: hypothetical protein ACYC25_00110 [Paludibacter sp.]
MKTHTQPHTTSTFGDRAAGIILYSTPDGKAQVSLYERNGSVWLNQNQLAEIFATSIPNISMHVRLIYDEFNARRKKFDADKADIEDINILENLNKEIENRKIYCKASPSAIVVRYFTPNKCD